MMNLPPKQGLAFRRKHPLNEDLAGIRIKYLENQWPPKRAFREKITPFYAFSWPRMCTPRGTAICFQYWGDIYHLSTLYRGTLMPPVWVQGRSPWETSDLVHSSGLRLVQIMQHQKDSVCSEIF